MRKPSPITSRKLPGGIFYSLLFYTYTQRCTAITPHICHLRERTYSDSFIVQFSPNRERILKTSSNQIHMCTAYLMFVYVPLPFISWWEGRLNPRLRRQNFGKARERSWEGCFKGSNAMRQTKHKEAFHRSIQFQTEQRTEPKAPLSI